MLPAARFAAALALLASGVAAQASGERRDAQNEAWRAERLAITGDLGAPPLPPPTPGGPPNPDGTRPTMVDADRSWLVPDASAYAGAGQPVLVDAVIPAGPGGTGLDLPELFQYQLPVGYDAAGPPLPLVVCYHGYGESAKNVAAVSLLDEEANARGWIYMAPTGIDDQLFGSPVSQQATESAIAFMLDTFAVDPDRVYLVGFSMGGGIVGNFAARRRDPAGLMVAAVALVAPACDWTMTYQAGTAATKAWLENPYNFGAKPGVDPFAYQRASVLHFDKQTYVPQPLPGVLLPELSMGRNLGTTPVFLTFDVDDPLALPSAQDPVLDVFLRSLGGEVTTRVVSGTVAGVPAQPAPHSWAVLDAVELFDWLDGRRVQRRPLVFDALLDGDTAVGHVSVAQRHGGAFTTVQSRDGVGRVLSGVRNAAALEHDASRLPAAMGAGVDPVAVSGGGGAAPRGTEPTPERYTLWIDEPETTTFTIAGLAASPSRVHDPAGRLVRDVAIHPTVGRLALTVAGAGAAPAPGGVIAHPSGVALELVHDPQWSGTLVVSPSPVAIGQVATLDLAFGPGHPLAVAWLGLTEQLFTLPNGALASVLPSPASDVIWLPLSPAGRTSVSQAIPTDPLMQGQHLHLQAVGLDGSGHLSAVSNAWMQTFE